MRNSRRRPTRPTIQEIPVRNLTAKLIALPEIYPTTIKRYYPKLIKKDLHIAEAYRIGARNSPLAEQEKGLNPFQVSIDKKKDVWVDILLERKKGVSLRELRRIMQIHGKPGRSRIISGRAKVSKLPLLNEKALRLETSRPISKALDKSVKFIKANKTSLRRITTPINGEDLTGEGVIIGIIDDGCDFNHPNFKKPDGKTRLRFLWDQTSLDVTKHPEDYPYGAEYAAADINHALQTNPADPYCVLHYRPVPDAHGTHVMDIAAGRSANPKYVGVAPGAELIFVQLGSPTDATEIEGEERGTFGSSKYLVNAFNYILEKAGNKPVVINMSLATNGGAHNGKSLTDRMFDDQLRDKSRALVIAAGNAGDEDIHFSREIQSGEDCEILWDLPGTEDDRESSWYTRYEIEIWYPKSRKMRVEVSKPGANLPLVTCPYNEEQLSPESPTQPLVLITNIESTADEENHVDILVDHRSPSFVQGTWCIRLVDEAQDNSAEGNALIHAWIERNDRYPSSFAAGSTREFTINGIGTASLPIVVGAYEDDAEHHAAQYTSFGPSRNALFPEKPDISAPGQNITSAQSLRGNTVSAAAVSAALFTEQTSSDENGTSMAAPHVAGVIALMFHAAKLAGRSKPKAEEIRQVLKDTAIAGEEGGHNRQLGYGRVNALEAIRKIIQS